MLFLSCFFLQESEGYEFQLISMDRQWNFEAHSAEDRDEWVAHIDQAIITRLQLLESSSKRTGDASQHLPRGHSGAELPSNSWGHSVPGGGASGTGGSTGSDPGGVGREPGSSSGGGCGGTIRMDEAMARSLRSVAGNDVCADCGAPGEFLAVLSS